MNLSAERCVKQLEQMKAEGHNFPVKSVIPLDQMVGGDSEDTKLLRMMASGAENFLRCFPWCRGVRETYYGDGYGGIVAVFLFRIDPAGTDVDEWLWVIFGDVPPAYLVTEYCKTPSQALDGYLGEIAKWVKLAKEGQSSKSVIPVYVPATPENAADVEKRMKLIQDVILPAFKEAEAVRS